MCPGIVRDCIRVIRNLEVVITELIVVRADIGSAGVREVTSRFEGAVAGAAKGFAVVIGRRISGIRSCTRCSRSGTAPYKPGSTRSQSEGSGFRYRPSADNLLSLQS